MNNWKTTVGGLLVGAGTLKTLVDNGADIGNLSTWLLPVLVAIFGYICPDKGTPRR